MWFHAMVTLRTVYSNEFYMGLDKLLISTLHETAPKISLENPAGTGHHSLFIQSQWNTHIYLFYISTIGYGPITGFISVFCLLHTNLFIDLGLHVCRTASLAMLSQQKCSQAATLHIDMHKSILCLNSFLFCSGLEEWSD